MRGKPWAAALMAAALLLLYFASTGAAVSLSDWLESFSWAPASRPFRASAFAAVLADSAWASLLYAAWMASAFCLGILIRKAVQLEIKERLPDALITTGLGMGSLSLLGLLLGLLGLYRVEAAFFLMGLPLAAALRRAECKPRIPGLADPFLALGAALGLAVALFHLIGALLPPASFDEMNYQLALPKLYALNGGIVSTPYNHLSFLPRNMNMLFVLGLLTGGPLVAKLFSFGAGVLACLALYALGRRHLGERAAGWGTLIFFMMPVIGNQFRMAGADLGMAFYELLALTLLLEWSQRRQTRLLLLSSAFWGLAAGCKYTALMGTAASALAVLWLSRREAARRRCLELGALLGPCLLILSPWLIKNWLDTGNPVTPIWSTLIPSRNFFFAGRNIPLVDYSVGLGIPNYFPLKHWKDVLLLPWNLTIKRDFSHDLGPIFLMGAALSAGLAWRRPRGPVAVLAALSALYWAGWLQNSVRIGHYFVVGLALTSLWVGLLMDKAQAQWPRAAGAAALSMVLIALIQQGLGMTRIQNTLKKPWGYLAGRCSLEEYLGALFIESPIGAYRFVNSRLPREATVLLIGEFRTFYLDRNFIASTPWDHDYWHEWTRLSSSPQEMLEWLKRRGVSHVLVNEAYVLRQTGHPIVHPELWTPEDRTKARRFLRACVRPIFRDGSVWVGEVLRALSSPRPSGVGARGDRPAPRALGAPRQPSPSKTKNGKGAGPRRN